MFRTMPRITRYLEKMICPDQKDGFEETHKWVQHWKPRLPITKTVTELRSELIPCTKDGSQSWIVISRGVNKFVTELPEEKEKLPNSVEAISSTGEIL